MQTDDEHAIIASTAVIAVMFAIIQCLLTSLTTMASSNPNNPSQNYENFDSISSLSPLELARLRLLLLNNDNDADSDYSEFAETTHAWAVFADNPEKRATKLDRLVGSIIIVFQLFTYYLFASEAIQDYQLGAVSGTSYIHSIVIVSLYHTLIFHIMNILILFCSIGGT